MALTPETAAALKDALEAVIQECGDTPGYEDLVAKLQDAEQAIPEVGAEHEAPEHGEHDAEPDAEDDAYSFEHAERKHKAARKKPKADGEHDGGNPFAKKGE